MSKEKEKDTEAIKPSALEAGVLELLRELSERLQTSPAETIKAYAEAQKAPTKEELQKKAEQRWRMQQDKQQQLAAKKAKEEACGHVHPDNGKSRMFKVPVAEQLGRTGGFPRGAGVLMCSNCFYTLRNYEITHHKVPIEGTEYYRVEETVKLIRNPEFDQWFKLPTVSQGTSFFGA